MRFAKIALVGVVSFLSSHNLAFAADQVPFIVTSGGLNRGYDTVEGRRYVEAKIKEDGIRGLLAAYKKCNAEGNTAIISIPRKSVACELNEHRPRGKHIGACTFGGSTLCISKAALAQGAESRLGSEVVDLISGQKSIELPDGTKSDFSEFRDELGR